MEECEFDYTLLKEKIRKTYGTILNFTDDIGIPMVSFSRKLNNKTQFRSNEVFVIAKKLGISTLDIPEYFYQIKN